MYLNTHSPCAVKHIWHSETDNVYLYCFDMHSTRHDSYQIILNVCVCVCVCVCIYIYIIYILQHSRDIIYDLYLKYYGTFFKFKICHLVCGFSMFKNSFI